MQSNNEAGLLCSGAYVERRTTEGRTLEGIRHCLKRYLARRNYRHLNTAARTDPATAGHA
ncbi:hypothetical protein GCM10009767_07080 [Kocuria aegyptia]|uniref:Transposase n=1 Tax=Kocuria aegyptia TaxID=330943 RepID=A0ABN2K965_9MICC